MSAGTQIVYETTTESGQPIQTLLIDIPTINTLTIDGADNTTPVVA